MKKNLQNYFLLIVAYLCLSGTGSKAQSVTIMYTDSAQFYCGAPFTATFSIYGQTTGYLNTDSVSVYQNFGDGNDTLVGDSDTLVALIAGGAAAPVGTFSMNTLIEDLSVAANSDNLNGDAGTNLLEQGNRALVPKTLVKKSSIASLSKTGVPAQPPVIDWKGGFCGAGCGPLASAGAGWHVGFVTALGRSAQEQNPNAGLLLRL